MLRLAHADRFRLRGLEAVTVWGPGLLMAAWVAARGPRFGGDTSRYLDGADRLLAGTHLVGKQAAYTGYIAVVAVARRVGGLSLVVALQLAVALALAWSARQLARELGATTLALAVPAYVLLQPEIATWHGYILADSLYTSAVVVVTWLLVRSRGRAGVHAAIAMAATLLAATIHPSGWTLPPLAAAYLVLARTRTAAARAAGIAAVAVGSALLLLLVPVVAAGIEEEAPAVVLRRGEVVYGYEGLRLAVPSEGSGTGIEAIAHYCARHPGACARVSAARVVVEVGHVRPYYSTAHNIVIVATIWPVYLLAGVALVRRRRQPLVWLLAAVVVAHLGLVAATWADYDGRFLVHILPVVVVLASLCNAESSVRGSDGGSAS